MYIKSLELINVRCFQQEKIELVNGINLLIGENNSGKSTVIKSVYKLQNWQTLLKDDIRNGTSYSKIFIELNDIDEKDRKLFYNNNLPNFLPNTSNKKIIFSSSGKNETVEERHFYEGDLKERRSNYDIVELTNDKGIAIQPEELPVFPDNENENNFIYPFLAKRKNSYYETRLGNGPDDTFKVFDDFRNLPLKVQKIGNPTHPQYDEYFRLCKEILGFNVGIVSGLNGSITIGIYTSNSDIIPIQSMGEGVINIVGLIVTLLTEDRKLYLIEELENDMHPAALKKLLNLIISKSNNNQFLISTHSNIVLKYLGSAKGSKIYQTEKFEIVDDKQPIPYSIILPLENTPEKRIEVLKELGYDFLDFELYESYLILEESSAERIIRDFLIPNIIPELNGRIKTIAAQGVDDLVIRSIDFKINTICIYTY